MMRQRPTPKLLMLGAGFGVWMLTFAAVYALQGIGCEAGWDTVKVGQVSSLRIMLTAVIVAGLGLTFAISRYASRHRRIPEISAPHRFLLAVAETSAIAATAAGLATFAGVVSLTACN